MYLLLLFFCYFNCFKIIDHIEKQSYYEVHPLFDQHHIKQPLLKKSQKNSEYQIVSLHDDKFYENVTWTIMINKPLKISEEDDLTIEEIKFEIEKDECYLYTSIFTKNHKLLKIGCKAEYQENVFIKPKKNNSSECEKTVKVRVKHFYSDLRDLIKQPILNNTLSLLIPIYGIHNVIIEKNFKYNHPKTLNKISKDIIQKDYHTIKDELHKNYFTKTVQSNVPSWGLDRIDQDVGLDHLYHYNNGGIDITALIIDTGIRTTHVEFGGRAQMVVNTANDGIQTDCHGHGIFSLLLFNIN